MQPDLFEELKPPAPPAPADPKDELHRQLVKLGDMLGDGLGDEPGGGWIAKDYRRICKALGYGPPRRNRSASINVMVAKYLDTARCSCGGLFKQTRSGAMRVLCTACCKTYRLKTSKKPRLPAGA